MCSCIWRFIEKDSADLNVRRKSAGSALKSRATEIIVRRIQEVRLAMASRCMPLFRLRPQLKSSDQPRDHLNETIRRHRDRAGFFEWKRPLSIRAGHRLERFHGEASPSAGIESTHCWFCEARSRVLRREPARARGAAQYQPFWPSVQDVEVSTLEGPNWVASRNKYRES